MAPFTQSRSGDKKPTAASTRCKPVIVIGDDSEPASETFTAEKAKNLLIQPGSLFENETLRLRLMALASPPVAPWSPLPLRRSFAPPPFAKVLLAAHPSGHDHPRVRAFGHALNGLGPLSSPTPAGQVASRGKQFRGVRLPWDLRYPKLVEMKQPELKKYRPVNMPSSYAKAPRHTS